MFPAFYEALFESFHAEHPDAVITEYAWGGSSGPNFNPPVKCDPCPDGSFGPPGGMGGSSPGTFGTNSLWSLGADLLAPASTRWAGPWMKAEAEAGLGPITITPLRALRGEGSEVALEEAARAVVDARRGAAEATGTSAPTAPTRYDAAPVRAALDGDPELLGACYLQAMHQAAQQLGYASYQGTRWGNRSKIDESAPPPPIQIPVYVAVRSDRGQFVSVDPSQLGLEGWSEEQLMFSRIISHCLAGSQAPITPPPPETLVAHAILEVDLKVHDPEWLQVRQWTITRLTPATPPSSSRRT